VQAFLDRVQEKTGIRPLIYSRENLIEGLYPDGACPSWLKSELLWIAEYPLEVELDAIGSIPAWVIPSGLNLSNIVLWQYTDDGVVGGVGGNNVDLNMINPDYAAAIHLTPPGDSTNGATMIVYEITPDKSAGCKIRKDHSTASIQIESLAFGKRARGNLKWGDGIQELWLHITEFQNPQGAWNLIDGWIASKSAGSKIATITEVGVPDPDPNPDPTPIPLDKPVSVTVELDGFSPLTLTGILKPQ
jgi:hypothetical protein